MYTILTAFDSSFLVNFCSTYNNETFPLLFVCLFVCLLFVCVDIKEGESGLVHHPEFLKQGLLCVQDVAKKGVRTEGSSL